jgi:hypothetical protein
MELQCAFYGNGDIYGLGVRIGIYLQWFTSVLAENLYAPAVESTRAANTTYQVAMLAGLILITTQAGFGTRALEGFITLLFCFASAWIGSMQIYSTIKSDRSAVTISGNAGGLADLLLNTAICSYGVWFLFVGIDTLPRTNCPEIAFFFAPVKLFGRFRLFLKVVFVAGLIGSVVLVPLQIILIAHDVSQLLERWGQPSIPSPRQTELVRTVNVSTIKFFGGIAAMATFILAVELVLVWNHIQGVYSCSTFSQLFPLVVGATNFARVLGQQMKSVFLGDTRISWTF